MPTTWNGKIEESRVPSEAKLLAPESLQTWRDPQFTTAAAMPRCIFLLWSISDLEYNRKCRACMKCLLGSLIMCKYRSVAIDQQAR